jgi:hypothetical protein
VAYLCSKVLRKRKKKRKFWVHPLLSDRSTKGLFNLFYIDLRKYKDKFFNYLEECQLSPLMNYWNFCSKI